MTGTSVTALLVVDVQNDFCEGGSLAVAGGAATAAAISRYLAEHHDDYALVVVSLDWHRGGHDNRGHFAVPPAEPDFADTWPVHCVADSAGAQTHPTLDMSLVDVIVRKGYGEPAYSAFEGVDDAGRSLDDLLADHGVRELHVVGIATDVCVRDTALSARQRGYATTVLRDLTAAADPGRVPVVERDLAAAGCTITSSE